MICGSTEVEWTCSSMKLVEVVVTCSSKYVAEMLMEEVVTYSSKM